MCRFSCADPHKISPAFLIDEDTDVVFGSNMPSSRLVLALCYPDKINLLNIKY